MNDNLRQTLQEIVNMSDEDKVNLGKDALSRFVKGLMEGGIEKKDISDYIIALTKLFVSSDRKCSAEEYSFFRAVTGLELSSEDFYNMTNGGSDPDFIKASFKFLSILTPEDRTAAIVYGSALISCDDSVNIQEFALIDTILSL